MAKLDTFYVNSASTSLLQRYKHDFIKYNNKTFPNNLHIHLRACDAVSSYKCTHPITESNIPKWDHILNCCSVCLSMNAPYLESSEQLDRFFPGYLHIIKFHIFQNISKCSIHGLTPFKYNNTCEICDNILDKENRRRMIVMNFFLHEEVIDVFRENSTFPL